MAKVEIINRGKSVRVHPRLADLLVARGGYMRRDMIAVPVTGYVEVDAEGLPWNPSLHIASRAKTKAGTWRKKPQTSVNP